APARRTGNTMGRIDCGQEVGTGVRDRARVRAFRGALRVGRLETARLTRVRYIPPRLRIAARCSLIRNTIRTNSAAMRANRIPTSIPTKLASAVNAPAIGLNVI